MDHPGVLRSLCTVALMVSSVILPGCFAAPWDYAKKPNLGKLLLYWCAGMTPDRLFAIWVIS
jgi:hypothetical protein